MVPTPYNVRWTAKLIRRDIKIIAARYTSKVRDLFKRTSVDTSDLNYHVTQADIDTVTAGESVLYNSRVTQADTDQATDRESVFYKASESLNRPSPDGPDTDGNDLITPTEGPASTSKVFTTPYQFLTASHKELFASRERGLLCKERWLFRGSWLLLHQAIQYHDSNPIYEIWKDSASEVEDAAALEPFLRK